MGFATLPLLVNETSYHIRIFPLQVSNLEFTSGILIFLLLFFVLQISKTSYRWQKKKKVAWGKKYIHLFKEIGFVVKNLWLYFLPLDPVAQN